ncbi:MAG: 4'-phosphopantetheinyl transferase superfamily protein [Actinomycetota bacterium]
MEGSLRIGHRPGGLESRPGTVDLLCVTEGRPGTVDLLCVTERCLAVEPGPDAYALLDESERLRARRYHRVADRARFVAAAGLVRRVAARLAGCAPHEIALDRRCDSCGRPHGKPRLRDRSIEVSISHAGDHVAAAASAVGPVGVDVEQVGGVGDDRAGLLDLVCGPGERTVAETPLGFYRLWTDKEAVLKATGDGLRVPMSEVVVAGPRSEPGWVTVEGSRHPLVLQTFTPGPGHVGSIAVLAPGPVHTRVEVRG